MTDREAAALCHALGHDPAGTYSKTPEKHRFECTCGYVSVYRRTLSLAVEAGIHHMRTVARHAAANGANIPTGKRVAL